MKVSKTNIQTLKWGTFFCFLYYIGGFIFQKTTGNELAGILYEYRRYLEPIMIFTVVLAICQCIYSPKNVEEKVKGFLSFPFMCIGWITKNTDRQRLSRFIHYVILTKKNNIKKNIKRILITLICVFIPYCILPLFFGIETIQKEYVLINSPADELLMFLNLAWEYFIYYKTHVLTSWIDEISLFALICLYPNITRPKYWFREGRINPILLFASLFIVPIVFIIKELGIIGVSIVAAYIGVYIFMLIVRKSGRKQTLYSIYMQIELIITPGYLALVMVILFSIPATIAFSIGYTLIYGFLPLLIFVIVSDCIQLIFSFYKIRCNIPCVSCM
jgi:hypothetical protein